VLVREGGEAGGLALGLGDLRVAIALGALLQLRGLGARPRQQLVAVALRLVEGPARVLGRGDDVVEGGGCTS
jgi:hypothetical protein